MHFSIFYFHQMAFPCFKFQKFSGGVHPHTPDHCYPPLISNDKWWLFFFTFCAFFPLFISNTSIVSINFGANAQNFGCSECRKWHFRDSNFKNFLGDQTPPPHSCVVYWPHTWYIGLQPLLSPSNILSHRKVPFQKMPPHGKILKKGPE